MGTKISSLPAAIALAGAELVAGVQLGSNVKITATQLRTFCQSGLAVIASTGSGADLAGSSVSPSKLTAQANNTVLGNVSGGSASPSALTIAQLALLATTQLSTQTGTAYTAVLTDAFNYIRFTNGSAISFTIPPNSSVAFPINTVIEIEQAAAGALSVVAGGGVTINSRGADLTLAGQYAVAALKKVATDTWTLVGDL